MTIRLYYKYACFSFKQKKPLIAAFLSFQVSSYF